jgi:hypothetical protein
MQWIVTNMKWIMLLSGALTSTMLYAAIAPDAVLQSTFGESLDGPVADVVVRNWGFLIGLVGGMLIYGAFDPPARRLILTVAGLSKIVFIGLIVAQGTRFLGGAAVPIAIDSVMIVLFACYLVVAPRRALPAHARVTA